VILSQEIDIIAIECISKIQKRKNFTHISIGGKKTMKRLLIFTLFCAFFGILFSKTYTSISSTIQRFPLHPLPPNTCKTKYWNPVSPEQIPKPLEDDIIDVMLLEAPVFSWKIGQV
jgi:hypothetical protein